MAVELTTNLSIWLQLFSFVAIGGLSIPVAPRDEILKELIKVEIGVQAVELGFYATFLKRLSVSDINGMAKARYYDWILTTPTMLFTTMIYLSYEKYPERTLTIQTVWQENQQHIKRVLASNVMMMLVGYLGETGQMEKKRSVLLGFVFLLFTFLYMNEVFASNQQSQQVINAMFFLWTLYGVAAMLTEEQKNIMYNFLDLFAKNFFGLYLFLKVRNLRLR